MANFFKKMAQSLRGETETEGAPAPEPAGGGLTEGAFVMPVTGTVMPLADVPDPVFAQEMMGPGFAVDPEDGTITSPVNGKIVSTFPTKHAVGLMSDSGVEVLIHIGLDTVKLNGEGFDLLVEDGQEVRQGEPLLKADFAHIRANAPSAVTPIIFTNTEKGNVHLLKQGRQESGTAGIVKVDG